jgi:DNA-directed RNA polymerase subunit RPC12/RpoP
VPYVRCTHCGLSEFSAAIYSYRHACSRCGALVPLEATRPQRLRLLADTARKLRRRSGPAKGPPGRSLV